MSRLLALLALAAALVAPAALHARDIVIEDFAVTAEVRPDGDVQVTEILRVRFTGSWNGIFRDLSLRHHTAEGRRERLDVRDVRITDETGRALEFHREGDRWTRRWRIRVPGAEDAVRTVVIRYRVENAVRFFRTDSLTVDELYWNVTGNQWEVPIEQVRARFVLPPGAEVVRAAAYTGYAGADEDEAEVAAAGNEVNVRTREPFAPGEGLTVGVAWPTGFVPAPTARDRAAGAAWRLSPLLLPFLVLLAAHRAWRRRGRDPEARAIAVQYEPPQGLSPAELGTLVDHDVEMHDVTAILVDLAVRGHVDIEETEEKKLLGLVKSTEYTFHVRKPNGGWKDLEPYEEKFLSALWSYGSSEPAPAWTTRVPAGAGADVPRGDDGTRWKAVAMDDLKNRFYKDLPEIKDAVYDRLVARGFYVHRPDRVKGAWLAISIVVLMAGIGAAIWVGESGLLGLTPGPVAVGGVAAAIIAFVYGRLMPARTVPGARAREAALGFREWLARVEEPRFRATITSPELFETYLPHAMAFRVEGRWSKAFEGMLREPPRWYHGGTYHGGGFSPSGFAGEMRGISSSAGAAMASSPSSSGSGGGGSSGGGSGGGGGGGW